MASLISFNTSCPGGFNLSGFAVYKNLQDALDLVESAVNLSSGDDEWVYFGSNDAIGDLDRKDFHIKEIDSTQEKALEDLFFNIYTDSISYGIMEKIINAVNCDG